MNFALPIAEDNCGEPLVTQTDATGLEVGDLFPVGLTLLEYTAEDDCGNTATCELKVVVNDFHTPPSLGCPDNIEIFNDPGQCGAIPNNDLSLLSIEDNCPDNIAVTFEIVSESGNVIGCGIDDATGSYFETGVNSVTYKVQDQPILLITEVIQNGMTTGIEITNFGPASMDISCMEIAREGASPEAYEVPNGTIIGVGEVYTQIFTNISAGAQAGYTIGLLENVIDAVAINGYTPSDWEWAGFIFGDNIIRNSICDNNLDSDWQVATPCNSGSFGLLNPGLPVFSDNGLVSSLQSEPPSIAECTFDVVVLDNEAPMCAMHDSLNYVAVDVPVTIASGSCVQSIISVNDDVVINDVNLSNIRITHPNAGGLTLSLVSPSGTEVVLVSNICSNEPNIDIGFDDQADLSLAAVTCAPLGGGQTYEPSQSLKALYLEPSQGDWTLSVYSNDFNVGSIDSWSLQILETTAYNQPNVTIDNDLGFCGANYSWTHPVFEDNCCDGSIVIDYLGQDGIGTPSGGAVVGGTSHTAFFEVGTTIVTYTLTDQFGNQSTCSFEITVEDGELPVIPPEYCQDQIVTLQPGQCDISLPTSPIVTDNCNVNTITYEPPLNNLPIGINEITLLVTDDSGNVASCTFEIDVREFPNPSGSLACNDVINLSLGSDCETPVTADMLLEGGPYACYDNYCIEITDQAGNIHDPLFDITDVGQQFNVTIVDCLGNGNSCDGVINVEQKIIPEIACPSDTLVYCNQDLSPDSLGYATLESCEEEFELTYWDEFTDFGACADPRAQVVRTWTIIDETGNVATCDQLITIKAFDLDVIEFPEDIDFNNPLECSDVITNPLLTDPDSTGYPMINGQPIFNSSKGLCMYSWNWDDQILYSCGSSYEILRTWIVRDMCQPVVHQVNPIEYVQIIKVVDSQAPEVHECEQDITLSTNPWNCGANTVLPMPDFLTDNCSDYWITYRILGGGFIDVDTLYSGDIIYSAINLGIGMHRVEFRVKDDCGNYTDCGYNILVEDNTGPIAITTQNVVVNLTSSGDIEDQGSAKLYAESFDNGSYDGCGDIKIEIRREGPAPTCDNIGNNGHNNNITYSSDSNIDPYDSDDTDNGEFVKFCCEDLEVDSDGDGEADGLVKVWLRVTDEQGNFTESWSYVRVESKLPPIIDCPESLVLDCNVDINDFTITGLPSVTGICGATALDWTEEMIETEARKKPASVEPLIDLDNDGQFDEILAFDESCRQGALRRRFMFGGTVVCEQWLVLEGSNNFNPELIDWPYDKEGDNEAGEVTLLPDNSNPTYSEVNISCVDELSEVPEWVEATCNLIGFTVDSDTFYFEDDACQKIINTYTIIDWCNYEINFEEPGGDLNGNGIQDGIWKWTVIGKLLDTYDPVVTAKDSLIEINSGSGGSNSGINCVASGLSMSAIASDLFVDINGDTIADACPSQWLKWNVYLDINNDWIYEREWSSFVPEDRNTSTDPLWSEDNSEDNLMVYGYEIPDVRVGNRGGVDNALNLATPPGFEYRINIPDEILADCGEQQHRIVWKVYDGCGNQTSTTSYFTVEDKKAPTPYCIDLSTALMVNGSVEVWACDFNLGSIDNCTGHDELRYTFSDTPPSLDPDYREDLLCSYKEFTSDDINGQPSGTVMQPVYVWDNCGNYDFCEVELRLVDNGQGNVSSIIAGSIETNKGDLLSDVDVTLESNHPEYPRNQKTEDGKFVFEFNPNNYDYKLSAKKDIDHLNGVSTIDLIFMQRHILGLQVFNSPFKYIAADINNDRNVTAIDLLELRKLILGLYDDFPDNESWRFINNEIGVSLSSPYVFAEQYEIENISSDKLSNDFVAVKIGDVNESIEVSLTSKSVEERSNEVIELGYEINPIEKSNQIVVPIYLDDTRDVKGFQMTLHYPGLKLVELHTERDDISDQNIGRFNEKLSFSYFNVNGIQTEGKPLFNLVFESYANVSDVELYASSEITRTEAYTTSSLLISDLSLKQRTVDNTFVLYQNEPNPFNDFTFVKMYSPRNMKIELNIWDANNRLVKTISQNLATGDNYVKISKDDLPVAGIFYYDVIVDDQHLRKRLIHID